MGRIRDAVKTLLGRSQAQIELARMRADFADLMLEISNAMEKLKTASLKFAKRDTRAMGAAFEDRAEIPVGVTPDKWNRRGEIMRHRGQHLPTTKEPPDVSGDQDRAG
jgi:hypothetical protein